MIVSFLNGQYIIGQDLSKRGAEVFSITNEEFQKLQSGLAIIVDSQVVDVEIPEPVPPTKEELEEIKNNTLIEIKIPLAIVENVKDKLNQLMLLFSKIKREPQGEYLVLSNILFKHIPQFLTKEEHTKFKGAGVIFDELVNDLYSNN